MNRRGKETAGMGRSRDNDRLPTQALALIVWAAANHINFFTAPRDIVAAAGRDAWLATAISFVLNLTAVLLPLVLIVWWFPRTTLVEVARTVFGRTLGWVLSGLYVAFWLATGAWLVLVHSHLVIVTLLPQTPIWVLNVTLVLVSTYIVRHGLEPIGRLFVLSIPAFIAPLAIATFTGTKGADLRRLLPVLAGDPKLLLQGVWTSFTKANGLSVVWMVGPYLTRVRGVVRSALVGVSLTAMPAVVLVTLLLARLGHEEVADQLYPLLIFIELLDIPGMTGFHLNGIMLAVWVVMAFATLALFQYAASSASRRMFRLPDNRWSAPLSGVVLIALSNAPISEVDLVRWANSIQPVVVSFASLWLPLLVLAVAAVRKWLGGSSGGDKGDRRDEGGERAV